jgi:cytochrome bd-type quinol oxidase subunit 2
MWNRKPSALDVSYLNLRLCIGVLGVALPFILRIGSAIFPPDPYSVSAYYYSAMRNILVASLCILGTFLLTYQGYDKLDSRITNLCGAATIGVALFPTSNPGFKPTWVGHVHPVVAAIALAGQALMALQFTQSAPRDGAGRWLDDAKRMLRALIFRYAQRVHLEHGKKLIRNQIYSACTWLIIIGVVLALVQNFWPTSAKAETQWLFWFESLSIASFGVAWLVKGETLLKDGAPARAVPVEAIAAQTVPADAAVEANPGQVVGQAGLGGDQPGD